METIYFISMGDYMDNKIHARAISRRPRKTVPYISFGFVMTERDKALTEAIMHIDTNVYTSVALVGHFFDDEKVLIKQHFNVISETPY